MTSTNTLTSTKAARPCLGALRRRLCVAPQSACVVLVTCFAYFFLVPHQAPLAFACFMSSYRAPPPSPLPLQIIQLVLPPLFTARVCIGAHTAALPRWRSDRCKRYRCHGRCWRHRISLPQRRVAFCWRYCAVPIHGTCSSSSFFVGRVETWERVGGGGATGSQADGDVLSV